ncbi:hypothetical protein ANANG_G00162450 [Anguilla anguilla]|uniref:Uncharacterized protein n=1 Tax=Anguilla anguilla TaxID=7936 RepID=A0A9D3MA51_ANGAN|nr:hypothetical protein ANANG_G00162450 [Anguilla anguilla]
MCWVLPIPNPHLLDQTPARYVNGAGCGRGCASGSDCGGQVSAFGTPAVRCLRRVRHLLERGPPQSQPDWSHRPPVFWCCYRSVQAICLPLTFGEPGVTCSAGVLWQLTSHGLTDYLQGFLYGPFPKKING